MCDYSLTQFPNRLAAEGEQLVVHRFTTRTLGLAPARCGWKQLLLQILWDVVQSNSCAWRHTHRRHAGLSVGEVEEVTFIEQSPEAFTYRDGVSFANGREILLQQLTCGQRAEVLSLGGGEEEPQPRRMQAIRRVFVE